MKTPKLHEPLPFSFGDILTAIADEKKPVISDEMICRPFLKWVGGKRSILPDLTARLPAKYKTYREPFVGGGALFFSVQPKTAYLSDINFHLILSYHAVRDDAKALIDQLKYHQERHNKEHYLKARIQLSTETDKVKIAALFIYLNKTCFNGLYRVNKEGKFNVPMGSYTDPGIYDETTLYNDAKALSGVTLKQHSYLQCPIEKEDFVYLDPPYHKLYAQYDSGGFAETEHKQLAVFCQDIHKAGAFFMLSNSDTDLVRTLYKDFHIEQVSASRSVSCKAHQRGKEDELIIRNYQ